MNKIIFLFIIILKFNYYLFSQSFGDFDLDGKIALLGEPRSEIESLYNSSYISYYPPFYVYAINGVAVYFQYDSDNNVKNIGIIGFYEDYEEALAVYSLAYNYINEIIEVSPQALGIWRGYLYDISLKIEKGKEKYETAALIEGK